MGSSPDAKSCVLTQMSSGAQQVLGSMAKLFHKNSTKRGICHVFGAFRASNASRHCDMEALTPLVEFIEEHAEVQDHGALKNADLAQLCIVLRGTKILQHGCANLWKDSANMPARSIQAHPVTLQQSNAIAHMVPFRFAALSPEGTAFLADVYQLSDTNMGARRRAVCGVIHHLGRSKTCGSHSLSGLIALSVAHFGTNPFPSLRRNPFAKQVRQTVAKLCVALRCNAMRKRCGMPALGQCTDLSPRCSATLRWASCGEKFFAMYCCKVCARYNGYALRERLARSTTKTTATTTALTTTTTTTHAVTVVPVPATSTASNAHPMPDNSTLAFMKCHAQVHFDAVGAVRVAHGGAVHVTGPNACCSACIDHRQCNLWIWDMQPQDEKAPHNCWLLASKTGVQHAKNRMLGFAPRQSTTTTSSPANRPASSTSSPKRYDDDDDDDRSRLRTTTSGHHKLRAKSTTADDDDDDDNNLLGSSTTSAPAVHARSDERLLNSTQDDDDKTFASQPSL